MVIVSLLIAIIVISSVISLLLLQQRLKPESTNCPKSPMTPYIVEYCAINGFSAPNAIATDSKGDVWFILQNESDLGVIFSSNSSLETFRVPTPSMYGMQSWGIAVDSSRNLVWFTDFPSNAVWSFNMSTRNFTSYDITTTAHAEPQQLVIDPKGNVWFAEYSNYIGEITTDGQQRNFRLPSELKDVPYSGPIGMTLDSTGLIWFTDPVANSIGSFNTSSDSFQAYNLGSNVSYPTGIAVDESHDVWITEHGPSLIAEFNPQTKSLRSITTHVPQYWSYSLPYFVYIDRQGNVWFNEHYGNAIGRFSPINSTMIEYLIPGGLSSQGGISGAITMALSQDGTPWFTEWFTGKIGKVILQAPIDIGFSFQNSTVVSNTPLLLSPSHNVTLTLNVRGLQEDASNLSVFYSTPDENATQAFNFTFSKSSGVGNFTSLLTIEDEGLSRGTHNLTISEISSQIIFSRVVTINVQ